MVLENFSGFNYDSLGANDSVGMDNMDPWEMVGRWLIHCLIPPSVCGGSDLVLVLMHYLVSFLVFAMNHLDK